MNRQTMISSFFYFQEEINEEEVKSSTLSKCFVNLKEEQDGKTCELEKMMDFPPENLTNLLKLALFLVRTLNAIP